MYVYGKRIAWFTINRREVNCYLRKELQK